MSIHLKWNEVLLDYNRTTEFSGDDADRYSALCDLGRPCDSITVVVPALDASAAISVYVQRDASIATVPVVWHHGNMKDSSGTGTWTTEAYATTSGAGGYTINIPLAGVQYLRLYTSANQAADRTFYVRGIRN